MANGFSDNVKQIMQTYVQRGSGQSGVSSQEKATGAGFSDNVKQLMQTYVHGDGYSAPASNPVIQPKTPTVTAPNLTAVMSEKDRKAAMDKYRSEYAQANSQGWYDKYYGKDYGKEAADIGARLKAMPQTTDEDKIRRAETQAEYDWLNAVKDYTEKMNYDVAAGEKRVKEIDEELYNLDRNSGDSTLKEAFLALGNVQSAGRKKANEEYEKRKGELEAERAQVELATRAAKFTQEEEKYYDLTQNENFDEYRQRGAENEDNRRLKYADRIGGEKSLYKFMDETEAGIYDYLLAAAGEDTAEKYFDHLQDTLNERKGYDMAQEKVGDINNDTLKALRGSAFSAVSGLASGAEKIGDAVVDLVSEADYSMSARDYAQQYVGQIMDEIDTGLFAKTPIGDRTLARTLYDLSYNIGDNAVPQLAGAVVNYFFPGVGTIVEKTIFAANVYEGARKEAYQEGHNANLGREYALMNTASETGLEVILGGVFETSGLTKLTDRAIRGIANGTLRAVARTGVKMIGEATEEGTQEILSPIIRNLAYGENNEINEETIDNAVYAAVIGALSVVPSAGVSSAVSVRNERIAGAYIRAYLDIAPEVRDDFYKIAAESGNKEVARYAEKVKAKESSGSVGRLAILMSKNGKADEVKNIMRQASENFMRLQVQDFQQLTQSNTEKRFYELAEENPGVSVYNPIESRLAELTGWDAEKIHEQARLIESALSGTMLTDEETAKLDTKSVSVRAVIQEFSGMEIGENDNIAEKLEDIASAAAETQNYQKALNESNRLIEGQKTAELMDRVDAANRLTVEEFRKKRPVIKPKKSTGGIYDRDSFVKDFLSKNKHATEKQAEDQWKIYQLITGAENNNKEENGNGTEAAGAEADRGNDRGRVHAVLGRRGSAAVQEWRNKLQPTADSGEAENSTADAVSETVDQKKYSKEQKGFVKALEADGFDEITLVTGELKEGDTDIDAVEENGKLTILWDNKRTDVKIIADHERVHRWLSLAFSGNDGERAAFCKQFCESLIIDGVVTESDFNDKKAVYEEKYRTLYGNDTQTLTEKVYEEMLCDMFAGRNGDIDFSAYRQAARDFITGSGLKEAALTNRKAEQEAAAKEAAAKGEADRAAAERNEQAEKATPETAQEAEATATEATAQEASEESPTAPTAAETAQEETTAAADTDEQLRKTMGGNDEITANGIRYSVEEIGGRYVSEISREAETAQGEPNVVKDEDILFRSSFLTTREQAVESLVNAAREEGLVRAEQETTAEAEEVTGTPAAANAEETTKAKAEKPVIQPKQAETEQKKEKPKRSRKKPVIQPKKTVTQKASAPAKPNVLDAKRDGNNGWGKQYGTAQEALYGNMEQIAPKLYSAYNDEAESLKAETPLINAVVSMAADVNQDRFTIRQALSYLENVYNSDGADGVKSRFDSAGNLKAEYYDAVLGKEAQPKKPVIQPKQSAETDAQTADTAAPVEEKPVIQPKEKIKEDTETIPPTAETEEAKKELKKAVRMPIKGTNEQALLAGIDNRELSMDSVTLPKSAKGFNSRQLEAFVSSLIDGVYSEKDTISFSVPYDGKFAVKNDAANVVQILNELGVKANQEIFFTPELDRIFRNNTNIILKSGGNLYLSNGSFIVPVTESGAEYAKSKDGYRATERDIDGFDELVNGEGTAITDIPNESKTAKLLRVNANGELSEYSMRYVRALKGEQYDVARYKNVPVLRAFDKDGNFVGAAFGMIKRGRVDYTDWMPVRNKALLNSVTGREENTRPVIQPKGKNGEKRYSVADTTDGRVAAVVDNDILRDIDTSSWNEEKREQAKRAANEALKKFKDGIVVNGITHKVNKHSRDEFTRSNYTLSLYRSYPNVFADKIRTADVADDVIVAATGWKQDGELKHNRTDNFVDFSHGRTLIVSGDNKYSADVVIGITGNGDYVFYDVVDMVPTDFAIKKTKPPTAAETQNANSAIHGSSEKADRSENSDLFTADKNIPQPSSKSQEKSFAEQDNNSAKRYSVSDTDYINAVNAGKTNTAKQMVDDAAQKAGYTLKAYHGTPNGTFTVFRGWQYFTPDRQYADVYQSQGASSNGYKKTALNPKTYDVYLKTGNVFDTRNDKERRIFLNEFYGKWGNGTPLSEKGLPDWTDGDDLIEFLEEKGYDYDTILLDEGATGGYGEKVKSRGISYVVKSPEQIKSADTVTYDDSGNIIPLSERFTSTNPDIRYSVSDNLKGEFEKLIRAADGDGEEMARLTSAMANRAVNPAGERGQASARPVITPRIKPLTEQQRQAQEERINELIERYGALPEGENAERRFPAPRQTAEGKYVRRGIRTMGEAGGISDDAAGQLQRLMLDEGASYVPISNKDAIRAASAEMNAQGGYAKVKNEWAGLASADHAPTVYDIVKGELLMIEAANRGDINTFLHVAADVAAMGTQAGQDVQAFRIIKKLGPSGQLYYINKAVDRLQKQRGIEIEIDTELARNLLTAGTAEAQETAMDELVQDIARQVPRNALDIWNAWRYFAMLSAPKTHFINTIGNTIMIPMRFTKDMIKAAGESLGGVARSERTANAAVLLRSREYSSLRKFAGEDFENVMKQDKADKYNPSSEILQARNVFSLKKDGSASFLDKWSKFNSDMLTKEDNVFKKQAYISAFTQYLANRNATAEQFSEETMSIDDRRMLNEARQYAMNEALKATYNDASKLADALNQFSKQVPRAGKFLDATLPFKRTPINIVKRGIEYSPIGILNGVKTLMFDVRSGKATATEAIDRLSAGMTGTAVAALGAFLASLGVLRGGSGDDKDEKAERDMGFQDYSITVDGKNFTVDWLAPFSLPLFVGVEAYKLMEEENGFSLDNLGEALGMLAEPMLSLTMLDGINDLIESAKYSEGKPLWKIMSTAAQSYVSQGIPTLFGQAARTIDPYRRITYVDKNKRSSSELQRFAQGLQGKIPIVSQGKTAYIDRWGNKETGGSAFWRFVQNFILPGYIKTIDETQADRELMRLYKATGDSNIIPSLAEKSFSSGGKTVNLTGEQYEKYATERGKTAYRLITELINSQEYAYMDDAEKVETVKAAFDYAQQTARAAVFGEYEISKTWIKRSADLGIEEEAAIRLQGLSSYSANAGYSVNDNELISTMTDLDSDTLGKLYLSKFSVDGTISDPNVKKHEYKLTGEEKARLWELYKEVFLANWQYVSGSSAFRNADADGKAEIVSEWSIDIRKEARGILASELRAAGRESVAK